MYMYYLRIMHGGYETERRSHPKISITVLFMDLEVLFNQPIN